MITGKHLVVVSAFENGRGQDAQSRRRIGSDDIKLPVEGIQLGLNRFGAFRLAAVPVINSDRFIRDGIVVKYHKPPAENVDIHCSRL